MLSTPPRRFIILRMRACGLLVLSYTRIKFCIPDGMKISFAGEQGLEPRYAASKAAVLPLDDSPILLEDVTVNLKFSNLKHSLAIIAKRLVMN